MTDHKHTQAYARCRNCGAIKAKNQRTGRWYCPARESHIPARKDREIWRGLLRGTVVGAPIGDKS